MAIPKQLQIYSDEKDFVNRFVIPLLQRLGFSIVVNYHGSHEFGKDIVFGQIDQFGHVVYFGLQAKFVQSISLNAIEDLINDAKQAFNNPFDHPQTGEKQRISVFYAVNAGSFSSQAKTNFFNALSRPYGGMVRLLDGEALLNLDRWAASTRGQESIEKLVGLLIEIHFNTQNILKLVEQVTKFVNKNESSYPMRRLRYIAIGNYLARPSLSGKLASSPIYDYYDRIRMFNAALDSIGVPLNLASYKQELVSGLREQAKILQTTGIEIQNAIASTLNELGQPISGI